MDEDNTAAAATPLEGAGQQLRRAREVAGRSLADIAANTRIPERHLAAIEEGNFAALPARTYAVGFSRSYAKELGLDDKAIALQVREELSALEPPERRGIPSFEPGDPNRVPGAALAWLSLGAAVLVILAGFMFWRSYYMPAAELPSLLPADEPSTAPSQPVAVVPPTPAAAGPVVFTAREAGLWVKFYDGAGKQLLQKELALGETYTVPADVPDVQLWTARPEALDITIGGQPVRRLSEVQRMMKDVPVSAAALLARGTASPTSASTSAPPAASAPAPRPSQRTATRPGTSAGSPAPSQSPTPLPAPAAAAPGAPATPAADR